MASLLIRRPRAADAAWQVLTAEAELGLLSLTECDTALKQQGRWSCHAGEAEPPACSG